MIEETFVDDPDDCQDYSVGSQHFECTASTEIEYVVESVILPSDGVVTVESQKGFPGAAGNFRMNNANHFQERNCTATREALLELFNSGAGEPWFITKIKSSHTFIRTEGNRSPAHKNLTMKYNFRFLLLTLAVALSSLFANVVSAQQNAVKITPLKPVFGKLLIQYERAIAPRTTLIVEHEWWKYHRKKSGGIFILGIISTSSEETNITGYRSGLMLRQYGERGRKGLFVEGGFYFGKHDIVVVKESETSSIWGIFLLNPYAFGGSTYAKTTYDDVRVSGLKLGCGWQKTAGAFSFEISGGVRTTKIHNRSDAAPHLKKNAPYTRLAVGLNF